MTNTSDAWKNVVRSEALAAGALKAVEIDGARIVVFRAASGALGALDDRCPHRFAPLSMGSVAGDNLHCIYHGLAFGQNGACNHNPHGSIPEAARVRSYPVREADGEIWIDIKAPEKPL